MLCRYYLQIDSNTVTPGSEGCYEVSECVVNGAELSQSFVRKDFGGVTRKYGSTIEFSGIAYDLLVEQYRLRYLDATAAFAIYVANDKWQYNEAWQCPLDFSTFSYSKHKVSLNCVDSSAASLIKANGGTKTSYEVSKLKETSTMKYDRIVMANLLKVGFDGAAVEGITDTAWKVTTKSDGLAHVATIPISVRDSSGVSDNRVTWDTESLEFYGDEYHPDDIVYSYDYFLQAGSARVGLTLDFSDIVFTPTDIEKTRNHAGAWQNQNSEPYEFKYHLVAYNDNNPGALFLLKSGVFSGAFTPFGGKVDVILDPYDKLSFIVEKTYWDEAADDYGDLWYHSLWIMYMSANAVKITWNSLGDPIYMDVIKPQTLLSSILDTVADGKISLRGVIESQVGGVTNDRLVGAMLIAAESVRGLPDAMIHTSFNEFCKFMETEYGYVYQIEDFVRPVVEFDGFIDPDEVEGNLWNGGSLVSVDEVYFVRLGEWESPSPSPAGLFVGYNDTTGKYYLFWGSGPAWSDYMHRNNYRNPYNKSFYAPNEDTVFVDTTNDAEYIKDADFLELLPYDPTLYMCQQVRFLHRSDLFTGDVVKELHPSGEPEFSLSDDLLYSAVTVGYEKQEYDNDNVGRDEWNFENEYTTGVSLKDQKLELVCPYRADCYGFEELAATREKPDNEKESTGSDEDVFIVKCQSTTTDGHWIIDRSVSVRGTYTDTVFNTLLAPMYMVLANKGFIASFCLNLRLTMTHGSRDVIIDGQSVTRDFDFLVADRLFKAGVLNVRTSDQDVPSDFAGLVSFEWDEVTYKGYVKNMTLKYQREESVEYELIEKSQI